MIYRGFCGPSNPSQSVIADCERLLNFYVEQVQSAAAPTGAALYPTPGQRAYIAAPQIIDVGVRAIFSMAGRAFAVVGTGFYELFATQTAIRRGPVAQDNYPATISYNGATGNQLFITSGGNGYVYNLTTNAAPTLVLNGEATMGGMLNARFLAFNILNGKVRESALNDGTTWDPTLYFQRTQAPDPWQAMLVNPPEIWMIGEQTGEVWYDAGNFPQPFAPIPGAFFKYGTPAPFSAGIAGTYVTWLGRDATGAGSIVAARGYTPDVISNYAVDNAIAGYARTSSISDAEVLVYEDQGHLFSNFSFPSASATWAVDMAAPLWAERGTWDVNAARYTVWSPRVHAFAFGKHLVGNRSSGTIFEMDATFGSEADGGPIRRLRIGPPLWAKTTQRLDVSRLEVMVESGLGVPIGQGSDPKVMLRTSENAKTWSAERLAAAGKMGQYNRRVFWTRCGSSEKLWVPEVSVSDPIPWRLSGAELEGSGFQQLASQQAAA